MGQQLLSHEDWLVIQTICASTTVSREIARDFHPGTLVGLDDALPLLYDKGTSRWSAPNASVQDNDPDSVLCPWEGLMVGKVLAIEKGRDSDGLCSNGYGGFLRFHFIASLDGYSDGISSTSQPLVTHRSGLLSSAKLSVI